MATRFRSRLYTPFRTPPSNETGNVTEIINLVSLDINENDLIMNNNNNIQLKIYTVDEIDAFVGYAKSDINNLYLFLSSDISNQLIPFIWDCKQIKSIYILHKNEQYQPYPDTRRKVRGVFHDVNAMVKQFQDDIDELYKVIYLNNSTLQNINPQSAEILWWKIFDKILLHIKHTDIAKDEMIGFFKDILPNDEINSRQLEELEDNYTFDRAIYWYTRESFVYRCVNKILRTPNNLKSIFKIRLVLSDLVRGLKTVQLNDHNIVPHSLTIYRGMSMKMQDIEQMKSNIGNSIFFGNFLSTSLESALAKAFAGSSSNIPDSYGVLLSIGIDLSNTKNDLTPVAEISKYSAFLYESEVLISMHSVFQIKSVKLLEDDLWHIELLFDGDTWDTDFDERSIFSQHGDQIFIRYLSKENKQFIVFQVLLDILLRSDHNDYARLELIEFARAKYTTDQTQLKQIDEFEQNYRSEDASVWYSKESFLYRILNESLRIEIVDRIVKMRYYIYDLHNQLARLQTSFIESLNGEVNLTLYRGQPMKIDQLNEIRENIGGFISMHSFLSATQDEGVAFMFSGDGKTTEPDEVSVIYEILIDTSIRSTPYAKIKSSMEDEQEILFSMGAVFRIEGVVDEIPHHDRVHRVKLTMEHIEDELWNKLTAHLD